MKTLAVAILMLFIAVPVMADEYLILNMGEVTSWQHRRFAGELAELDPIYVPALNGSRYALPIAVLSDPHFASVWDELDDFPVMELTREDFLQEDAK